MLLAMILTNQTNTPHLTIYMHITYTQTQIQTYFFNTFPDIGIYQFNCVYFFCLCIL